MELDGAFPGVTDLFMQVSAMPPKTSMPKLLELKIQGHRRHRYFKINTISSPFLHTFDYKSQSYFIDIYTWQHIL